MSSRGFGLLGGFRMLAGFSARMRMLWASLGCLRFVEQLSIPSIICFINFVVVSMKLALLLHM